MDRQSAQVELGSFRTDLPEHQIFALTSAKNSAASSSETKETIILVHGAIASRRYMIPTAKLLSKNFRVLVPDLPGHGASSKPEHALTAKQHADVLHQWIRALGLSSVHFLSNSYGCQIMAQFAAAYPESVKRLILSDPTGDPTAKSLWTPFFRLMMDAFVEPPFAPLMMFADIYDMGIRRTFETAHNMKDDDIRKNLPLIKAKTLVVRGANDFISPQVWCEQVTAMIPDARLEVIPNAPHSVNSAAAPELTRLINQFILPSKDRLAPV